MQGYDAIHDVTSIYDNVWWIAGGVLYMVSSNNMTGVDSLTLANSLIALEVPEYVPPTEEPTEVATEEVTVTFEAGRPVAINGTAYDPVALVREGSAR